MTSPSARPPVKRGLVRSSSRLSVEGAIRDGTHHCGRHHAVDRVSRGQSLPEIGRRHVEPRDHHPLHTPTDTGRLGVRVAGPFDDHERREVAGLLDAAPSGHVAYGIRTEDEEQVAVLGRQRLERVRGHRGFASLDLQRQGFDAGDLLGRGDDEGEAILGRRDDRAPLLPGISGYHQQDSVEAQHVSRLDRRHDVADVHRIKGSAEDSQTLDGGSLRARPRSPARNTPVAGQPYPACMSLDEREPSTTAHVLVRVWLPDRPGALGLVASRIGAVRGDIVGVDVLERGTGIAVDEFAVDLAALDLVPVLVREIEQVDGVSVEEVRIVGNFPDARLDALESATTLCESNDVDTLHRSVVSQIRREFLADWAALVLPGKLLASAGEGVPDGAVLDALASGTTASIRVADGISGPDDLAVAVMARHDATLLLGRSGHPLRRRERAQLLALAGIADRAWELLGGATPARTRVAGRGDP
jgi:hypothetical protein